LWAAIKVKPNKANDAIKFKNVLSPDLIIQFFATIATDENYNLAEIVSMRTLLSPDDYNLISSISFSELDIEPSLKKIKNTAPGYDNIPCWVFKTSFYEHLSLIIHLVQVQFLSRS
jgi:hypothetical protein